MPGLLDIAPSTKTVTVQGQPVAVHGLSAEGIAYILARFSVARELFAGRDVNLDADAIAKLAPEAVNAIIAAGTGYPNNPEAEAVAAKLPAGTQLDLLAAIVEVTMPGGVGPFVEKLRATFGGIVESGKAPATKSPQPSKA